jgi:hypothetical protein
MAKINQGILGGFSGSVGPVIGGSWKGIPYMRSKPRKYSYPPTEKQSRHWIKFAAQISFAKSLMHSIIKPIWDQKAVRMSGFDLFIKTNKDVFDDTGAICDFSTLKLSLGDLPLPNNIAVVNATIGNGEIDITWNNNSGVGSAAATDRLWVATLKGSEPLVFKELTFTRDEQQATIKLPFKTGDTVHVYVFFNNAKNAIYSECFHSPLTIL